MTSAQLPGAPQQRVQLPQPLPGIFQQKIFKQPKYDLRRTCLPSETSWNLFKPIEKIERVIDIPKCSPRFTRSIDINFSILDIPPSNQPVPVQHINQINAPEETIVFNKSKVIESDDIPVRGDPVQDISKKRKQKIQVTPPKSPNPQKQKSKVKSKPPQAKETIQNPQIPDGSVLLLPVAFKDVPTRFRQFGKFGEFRQNKFKNKK